MEDESEPRLFPLDQGGERFKSKLKEDPHFKNWLIIIAITAALIGLFLLWIFTQVFLFKKPSCCCIQNGCISSHDGRGGENVELSELSSLKDLPPSYSMLNVEIEPPKYSELFRPLTASRQTI
jgi:hypothetical protein